MKVDCMSWSLSWWSPSCSSGWSSVAVVFTSGWSTIVVVHRGGVCCMVVVAWSCRIGSSGRGHHCPLCVMVDRRCRATWSRLVEHCRPWRMSLSVVVAVVVFVLHLSVVVAWSSLVPPGCGPLLSMKGDNIWHRHLSEQGGGEGCILTSYQLLQQKLTLTPSLASITPACCHALPPRSWRSRVRCMLHIVLDCRRVVPGPMTTNNDQSLFVVWLPRRCWRSATCVVCNYGRGEWLW